MSGENHTPPEGIRESSEFPGYGFTPDGRYWCCLNTRRVRGPWRQLKGTRHLDGYLMGAMRNGSGKMRMVLLHRIILETFVGPCPDGMECLHRDNDKTNNAVPNLRWGSHRENIRDAAADGLLANRNCQKGSQRPLAKLTEGDIPVIRQLIRDGHTLKSIADRYGVHRVQIGHIKSGKGWKHVPESV
jgi:hypothetical protein